MGDTIYRPDAEKDLYVVVSTYTDSPEMYGSREEVVAYLREKALARAGEEFDMRIGARFERVERRRHSSAVYGPRQGLSDGSWVRYGAHRKVALRDLPALLDAILAEDEVAVWRLTSEIDWEADDVMEG